MWCQVDLNRDFPDPFERGSAGIVQPSGREQPETLALMSWIRSRHFVGSASLHEARCRLDLFSLLLLYCAIQLAQSCRPVLFAQASNTTERFRNDGFDRLSYS